MAFIVDFLLPRQPVSQQAKDSAGKRAWRDYVYGRAMQAWPARPLHNCTLKFCMVYIAEAAVPGDIGNFVKPVQDALCGLIYADDAMIRDVSAHLRRIGEAVMTSKLPPKLADAIVRQSSCVYVAISDSKELSEELRWI